MQATQAVVPEQLGTLFTTLDFIWLHALVGVGFTHKRSEWSRSACRLVLAK